MRVSTTSRLGGVLAAGLALALTAAVSSWAAGPTFDLGGGQNGTTVNLSGSTGGSGGGSTGGNVSHSGGGGSDGGDGYVLPPRYLPPADILAGAGPIVITSPPPAGPSAPTIAPAQAAQIAVAQLHLVPAKPGMGPDWNKNQFKFLPVGYPIWLWADGGTLRTVTSSQTVQGLTVALKAVPTGLSWNMGDGSKIVCGAGTPYDATVRPGTPSPTCGYRYAERGIYTVTVTTGWTVVWQAGGQGDTIPLTASTTRQIPIGELQSLITG